jgi:DNA-binding MarR family transcriptional regulator
MDDLILKTKRYLEDNLDASVQIRPIDLSAQLPYFYTEYYRLYNLVINGVDYLLCEARDILIAKQVRTQLAELESRIGKQTVYLSTEINASLRRSLVEKRVSFIIPKSQIYLPKLGIVFNDRYHSTRYTQDSLSPVAQVILIRTILNREYDSVTASEYAGKLSYAIMSVSRAFTEFVTYGLVSREEHWRRKPITWLYQGRELWEKALPLLFNPAQKSLWINNSERLSYCLAGISALSRYSMINEDDYLTYATISSIAKKDFGIHYMNHRNRPSDNFNQLQIWRYNPKLISNEDVVDRLSLYLSLKDSTDERIQIALDEMMAGIRW